MFFVSLFVVGIVGNNDLLLSEWLLIVQGFPHFSEEYCDVCDAVAVSEDYRGNLWFCSISSGITARERSLFYTLYYILAASVDIYLV